MPLVSSFPLATTPLATARAAVLTQLAITPADVGAADARLELHKVGPRSGRPAVTFVIDDGFPADQTIWAPIFEARGFKCCCALVSGTVAGEIGNNGLASHLTMQAAGHEMLSHSKSHDQSPQNMTEAQLVAESVDSFDKLASLGFEINGYVYPGNQHTETYRRVLADRYKFAFDASSLFEINHTPLTTFNIKRQAFGSLTDQTKTFATDYQPLIDSAIAGGGWLVFMMHSYPNTPGGTDGFISSHYQTQLGALLDYLVTNSSSIDVLTATEGFERFGNLSEYGDISVNPDANTATNRKWFAVGSNGRTTDRTILPIHYAGSREFDTDHGYQRLGVESVAGTQLVMGRVVAGSSGAAATHGIYTGSSTIRTPLQKLERGTAYDQYAFIRGPRYYAFSTNFEVLWCRWKMKKVQSGALAGNFRFFMGLAAPYTTNPINSAKVGLFALTEGTGANSNLQFYSASAGASTTKAVDLGIAATYSAISDTVWTTVLYPNRAELWMGYKLVATIAAPDTGALPIGDLQLAPTAHFNGGISGGINDALYFHSLEWGHQCPPF